MKKILVIIGLVVVFIFFFLVYSGLFTGVNITEGEVGPYTFVGKEYVGDYRYAGDHLDSIVADINKRKIAFDQSFGIYRDNPDSIAADSLRYMVGCIIPEKSYHRIPELEREGYVKQEMGKTPSVIVEFPLNTKVSFLMAVMKVYPALNTYFAEKGYASVPSLEIYDTDKMYITMEIKKQ
ncbi:MAG: hypothetical protein L3J74_16960 [Bacteroidales bacterium]|nr:hypothetical protein [Bacteroidales bacterium]